MNRKSIQAWDLYTRLETSAESLGMMKLQISETIYSCWWFHHFINQTLIGILHLLANDSYRTGQFNVAAKAFDALYKYDPSPEHLAAKKGACVGLFQMILTGKEDRLVTGRNLIRWEKFNIWYFCMIKWCIQRNHLSIARLCRFRDWSHPSSNEQLGKRKSYANVKRSSKYFEFLKLNYEQLLQ